MIYIIIRTTLAAVGKQTRRAGSGAPYQTSEETATVVQVRDGAGLM